MTEPEANQSTPASTSNRPQPNLFVRIWDAIFCWKMARRVLIGFAVLITLVAIVYLIEGIRGKSAWEKFQAEMKAAGEPLDPMELKPTAVPDEQNFAMTPLLAPLLDYEYSGSGKSRKSVWKNPGAKKRLDRYPGISNSRGIPLSNRHRRWLTDLASWQSWTRNNTNFSLPQHQLSPESAPVDSKPDGTTAVTYDTNFAAKEILLGLTTFDPEMDELHAAAQRPHAQFPIHYDEGFETLLPHLTVLRKLTKIAHLKAITLLADKRPNEALTELLLIIRISESFRDEPTLIAGLVHLAILNQISGIVWEGIARRQWTPEQQAIIEKRLRPVDFIAYYQRAMRGERAFAVSTLWNYKDELHRLHGGNEPNAGTVMFQLAPSGVFYQNVVNVGRMYDDYALLPINFKSRTIDLKRSREVEAKMQESMTKFHPYRILAGVVFPAINHALQRYAEGQAETDLIRLACAVGQFQAKNGKLPAALAELTPEFLPKLPHDPVNGKGYVYRVEKDDYLIYSLGADNVDDGGKVEWQEKDPNRRERTRGDWVWHSSAKAESKSL
jgi:hypothetical protein